MGWGGVGWGGVGWGGVGWGGVGWGGVGQQQCKPWALACLTPPSTDTHTRLHPSTAPLNTRPAPQRELWPLGRACGAVGAPGPGAEQGGRGARLQGGPAAGEVAPCVRAPGEPGAGADPRRCLRGASPELGSTAARPQFLDAVERSKCLKHCYAFRERQAQQHNEGVRQRNEHRMLRHLQGADKLCRRRGANAKAQQQAQQQAQQARQAQRSVEPSRGPEHPR